MIQGQTQKRGFKVLSYGHTTYIGGRLEVHMTPY